jgi:hypothetical protein
MAGLIGATRNPEILSPRDVGLIQSALSEYSEDGETVSTIQRFASSLGGYHDGATGYLIALKDELSTGVKRTIVRGSSYVVASSGQPDVGVRTLIGYGHGLGMTSDEVVEAAEYLDSALKGRISAEYATWASSAGSSSNENSKSTGFGWAARAAIASVVLLGAGFILYSQRPVSVANEPRPAPTVEAALPLSPAPLPTPSPVVPERPPAVMIGAKPAVGTNLVLTQPEIVYCLADKLRIETWKGALDGKPPRVLSRFNATVDEYNSRCGSYRYRRSDMDSAQVDVDRLRDAIQKEARSKIATW